MFSGTIGFLDIDTTFISSSSKELDKDSLSSESTFGSASFLGSLETERGLLDKDSY